MELNAKDPYARMSEWNPTADIHHVPMWFRMKVRKHIRSQGQTPSLSNEVQDLIDRSERRLFWDHFGSIKLPKSRERVFFTQPYPSPNDLVIAQYWAATLGCRLELPIQEGIWHPDTSLYIFHPLT